MSPESLSSFSSRSLTGMFTIFEQILRTSFNSLQLVGTLFILGATFFSVFFDYCSSEAGLTLFPVSVGLSLKSFSESFSSFSSKVRYPVTPFFQIHATICFISFYWILYKNSLYLLLKLSALLLILFLLEIYSKVLTVIWVQLDREQSNYKSSWSLYETFFAWGTGRGALFLNTLSKKS